MPTDWERVADELNHVGAALLGPLVSADEAAGIAALYDDDERFRSTIDMQRHRFGQGQYRYFSRPYPAVLDDLKHELYPKLLPIARDWWAKLGRVAPWPDHLDDWLEMCHAAGQPKSTAILLKYGPGDWNALHRDLYGELIFRYRW